jgi:hypothetical protein
MTWWMAALFVVGCAVDGEPDHEPTPDELDELEGLDDKSDAASLLIEMLGEVPVGYEVEVEYTPWPLYRGLTFEGAAGDHMEILVRSDDGDPVVWLFDHRFWFVGYNDDMNEGDPTANISLEQLPRTGRYYVIVRDKHLDPAAFKVAVMRLNLPAGAPSVQEVEASYEALVLAGTLADHEVAADDLPILPKGLHDNWAGQVAEYPEMQVAVYGLDVVGQTVWFVRKYLPGAGMEAGAYVETGEMIGAAAGSSELVDAWEY